ncbi:MAG: YbaK/EbsC family protein [Lapillicoccus sp.]
MGKVGEERALAAVEASGIPFTVTRHGPVRSLEWSHEEAAAARGVQPGDIVKSLVVRRPRVGVPPLAGDYLFVLVPGDRQFSWPKLRALLGVNRLSMPDAAVAKDVTGYERSTFTTFGSTQAWPVVADATVAGRTVSMGGGAHGVALTVKGDDVIRVLDAQVADISDCRRPRASAPARAAPPRRGRRGRTPRRRAG